jgi:hypothetical protein
MLSLPVLVRTPQYMCRNKNRETTSLYRSMERIESYHPTGVGARVKIGFIGRKKHFHLVDACWEGGGKATSVKGSDMERVLHQIWLSYIDRIQTSVKGPHNVL